MLISIFITRINRSDVGLTTFLVIWTSGGNHAKLICDVSLREIIYLKDIESVNNQPQKGVLKQNLSEARTNTSFSKKK